MAAFGDKLCTYDSGDVIYPELTYKYLFDYILRGNYDVIVFYLLRKPLILISRVSIIIDLHDLIIFASTGI